MPLINCMLSKNKIELSKEHTLFHSTSNDNLNLKSKYRSDDSNFISFNFSSRSLDSDISICNSSGIIVNFIGDITNRIE